MSGNMLVFLQAVLPYVFEALGVVLGLVALWAAHKFGAKLNVEVSSAMDQRLWQAAHNAVTYAEAWSLKTVKAGEPAPAGTEKMAAAMDFMSNFIKQKQLDKIGEDKLAQILEAALHVQRPPPIAPVVLTNTQEPQTGGAVAPSTEPTPTPAPATE